MGGKSSQSTQQVQIPPEVLARYNSVNATAEQAAATPFENYSTDPSAFVAQLNAQQQAGQAATNTYAQAAQPYFQTAQGQYGAATNLGLGAAQAVNPTDLSSAAINKYMSPYLQTVLGSQAALLNQQNQQQQAGQMGTAIRSGAFGGDRSGIAAANLAQQQSLANANIYSNILNQGYGQALNTAQQQQGVGLQAGEANRAALLAASQNMANLGQGYGALGTAAQTAGLQGAQAQMAAGQLGQQTEQAGKTALYNQYLQQKSYPFQTAQFLANIAEGTGALSGSTTTTNQPGGFFSDERLKENIEEVGSTHDGQPIYKYNYKGGDGRKQLGLLAQDVEQRHPEAVGLAGGYKTVDYDKATADASMGGHVHPSMHGEGFADGGTPMLPGLGGSDYGALLQAQQQMFSPYAQSGIPMSGAPHGGSSYVPQANLHVSNLTTAGGLAPQRTAAQNVKDVSDAAKGLQDDWKMGSALAGAAKGAYDRHQARSQAEDLNAIPLTENTSPVRTNADIADEYGFSTGGSADGMDDGLYGHMDYPSQKDKLDIPDDKQDNKLAVAGTPPGPGRSGMQDVMDVAKIASMFAGAARGGVAGGRHHYADGGNMPYSNTAGGGLDIPEVATQQKLQTAGSLNPQQSGLGQLASGVGAVGGLMSIGKMFGLASGGVAGREHHADPSPTGAVGDGDSIDPSPTAAVGDGDSIDQGTDWSWSDVAKRVPAFASHVAAAPAALGADALAAINNAVVPFTGGRKDSYLGNPFTQTPESLINYFSRKYKHDTSPASNSIPAPTSDKPSASGVAPVSPSLNTSPASNSIPAPTSDKPSASGVAPVSPSFKLRELPQDKFPQAQDLNVSAQNIAADIPSRGLAAAEPTQQPSTATPVVNAPADKAVPATQKSSFMDKLKSGWNEYGTAQNVIPFLTGLAAMGTAPTRSFGTALASGIGAGAQSYLPTQQKQAEIARTQASTDELLAQAGLTRVESAAQLNQMFGMKGFVAQEDPNGKYFSSSDGKRYNLVPSASMIQKSPSAMPTISGNGIIGKNGLDALQNEGQNYQILKSTNPNAEQSSNKTIEEVMSQGQSAQQDLYQIHRWEQSMASNKGVLAPSAYNELATSSVSKWNAVMNAIGRPELAIDGLSDAQIANKVSVGSAAAREANAGQRSFGSLSAFLKSTPNPSMDREAALKLIADEHLESQMAIDRMNYHKTFDQYNQQAYAPIPRNYLASNVDNAFHSDHTQNDYEGERNNYYKFISGPQFQALMPYIQNGTPAQKSKALQALDAKYGPNFHRWLTGAM